MAGGIFVPWLEIEPMLPEMKMQSLNHWTAKKVPNHFICLIHLICKTVLWTRYYFHKWLWKQRIRSNLPWVSCLGSGGERNWNRSLWPKDLKTLAMTFIVFQVSELDWILCFWNLCENLMKVLMYLPLKNKCDYNNSIFWSQCEDFINFLKCSDWNFRVKKKKKTLKKENPQIWARFSLRVYSRMGFHKPVRKLFLRKVTRIAMDTFHH